MNNSFYEKNTSSFIFYFLNAVHSLDLKISPDIFEYVQLLLAGEVEIDIFAAFLAGMCMGRSDIEQDDSLY